MYRFICYLIAASPIAALASEDVIRCNPAGTQSEMNICAKKEFAQADKELNDAYKSLIKKESDDALFIGKLKVAQNAWLKFRDAEIEARFSCPETDVQICWGTMYYMLMLSRKAALTRERTAHLRQILNDGLGE